MNVFMLFMYVYIHSAHKSVHAVESRRWGHHWDPAVCLYTGVSEIQSLFVMRSKYSGQQAASSLGFEVYITQS